MDLKCEIYSIKYEISAVVKYCYNESQCFCRFCWHSRHVLPGWFHLKLDNRLGMFVCCVFVIISEAIMNEEYRFICYFELERKLQDTLLAIIAFPLVIPGQNVWQSIFPIPYRMFVDWAVSSCSS